MEAGVCIAGAGPAGAFLAKLLSDRGYSVHVYDVAPKPGVKPCGWGVPYTVDRALRLPSGAVLARIREYTVTVDWGYVLHLRQRRTMGYIVDKPALISWLLEGVDVHWGRTPPAGCRTLVYARGHAYYRGEKAHAVQLVARGPWSGDAVEAYYFSDLPGYGWVFPLGRGYAKVGVGGEAPIGRLRERLAQMLGRLGAEPVSRLEGAPIAAGGLLDSPGPRIGEEAGAVMPLTGEGIRPALLTALAMAQAIEGRRGYRGALRATGLPLQIGVQLALRRLLLRLSPPERAALWRRVDPGTVARLAAGDVDRAFLARLALRHPRLAAIAARLLHAS